MSDNKGHICLGNHVDEAGGDVLWIYPPQPVTVVNKGLKGFPAKNVLILYNLGYDPYWVGGVSIKN